MSKFSERFKLLKEHEGITNKELAERLGMLPATLGNYLQGREPSYDVLMKIASYYNVSVDWLIGYSEFREENAVIDSMANSTQFKPLDEFNLSDQFDTFKSMLSPLVSRYRKIGIEIDLDQLVNEFWNDKTAHLLKHDSAFLSLVNSIFLGNANNFLFDQVSRLDEKLQERIYKSESQAKSEISRYLLEMTEIANTMYEFVKLYGYVNSYIWCDVKVNSDKTQRDLHDFIQLVMDQFLAEHPLKPVIDRYEKMIE